MHVYTTPQYDGISSATSSNASSLKSGAGNELSIARLRIIIIATDLFFFTDLVLKCDVEVTLIA